ncbi:piezo-type mechanosensitive ion channel homolog isoform X2 [Tripterygium wilfordii]|uniref:piezo-type mechanosensitive ion channel homolog isoform X2 n=1 Tax=Tripterygium wilfordii TaxID=458696 RepID=UPI0018F85B2F|nr:piezo-type mechanosensitive ion channel homolog isoform X2 [Tripterygium wilfordii]
MGRLLNGVLLPILLLTAALLKWSLISLADLLAFLFIQYSAPKIGFQFWRGSLVSWHILIFSLLAVLSHAIFHILCAIEGAQWSFADAHWVKLIGFLRVTSWKSSSEVYFLVVQVVAAFVSWAGIYKNRFELNSQTDSFTGHLYSSLVLIGSRLRVLCCLLLPPVQLVVGISHPSWASFPFFICSGIGLVDWSLTSNFLGLFRWWRYLLPYAGVHIALLYVYQLPVEFSGLSLWVAEFAGLYKVSVQSEWSEICSGLSLLFFYIMLSWIRCDLTEMEFIMSTRESNLTQQLLPLKHSFFIRELRSGVRHSNVLLRRSILRTFSINFFTYGFPISLLALSFWSFHFASLCAFGLLAYVGYILYSFPSFFHLHRLNGLLLVFILLWAASTYVFNVEFGVINNTLQKDMKVWETVGLWHYPIPGFYLLAQYCLGVLVALGNLVNNSIFLYLSDGDGESPNDDGTVEGSEDTKVTIVATIAWGLCKSSRALVLLLIFFNALKPGFIHAVYMVFFMMYLLSHTVSRRIRHSLILLCEVHFAILYILRLDLISKALEQGGSFFLEVLSQLGFLNHASSGDFLRIAVLACFCAIHNNGFEMVSSFSAIVQHFPCPPIGFSIFRAGLIKSVVLSLYISKSSKRQLSNSSPEQRVALYLSTVGNKFRLVYRACGTSIAFVTILLTVYLVSPNYTSFGYLFFLLLWIIGRQLMEKSMKCFWFPLKIYALAVFILIYSMSVFSSLRVWLSSGVDLSSVFGYNFEASIFENVWEPLAVLIVIQLYSYERRQSKYLRPNDNDEQEAGVFISAKHLLYQHSEKILNISLFYASLSSISAFGFIYIIGLVICSGVSRSSRVPAKVLLVYSGFLVMVEYLFQLCGDRDESGMRGKVLVVVACLLQYNAFHWLGKMPCDVRSGGKSARPYALFGTGEKPSDDCTDYEKESESTVSRPLIEKLKTATHSWPSFNACTSGSLDPMFSGRRDSEGSNNCKCSNGYARESFKENHKWTRKRIILLRKERLLLQKSTLKLLIKFWKENMFNVFGLEINMIALLLASFSVLNAISLLYVTSLAACIILPRHVISKLWVIFIFVFGSVVTLEYLGLWLNLTLWKLHIPTGARCNDCWRISNLHFEYCKKCWLGLAVDDPRMLISHYVVFMLACFKFHADQYNLTGSQLYQHLMSQFTNASGLSDLSFEMQGLWTSLDYFRLYSYCHLLDLVLSLVLITGTLEYDVLHLGYLGFALIFFRMRREILKKKNIIFKFLRMYNFALIVFSLAYQSPFVGEPCVGNCEMGDYVSEVIGFHKYDYGFRITSRSALVEIVIFMLVSLQSYMFASREFDYVSKYLEAEQIGAILHEQEKKAAWKTAQLQRVRCFEEQKRLRNLQVEKIKSEMLNLQIQLTKMNAAGTCASTSPQSEGTENGNNSPLNTCTVNSILDKEEVFFKPDPVYDSLVSFDFYGSPRGERSGSLPAANFRNHSMDSFTEITELNMKGVNEVTWHSNSGDQAKIKAKVNPLVSAVHLIGDGVSQVQSFGNRAVSNLVSFLNIENEETDSFVSFSTDHSSDDGMNDAIGSQETDCECMAHMLSVQSVGEHAVPSAACLQIRMIFCYIWAQIRSNNDFVCYCSFILIFLWNFTLLSMVYPAALFLYALCVNTGPSNLFWVVMLIYTEICILFQYLCQIIIQHCGLTFDVSLLQELGFPARRIMSSFVIRNLPLFLVYIFTLLQTTITARDGEWAMAKCVGIHKRRNQCQEEAVTSNGFMTRIVTLLLSTSRNVIRRLFRSLCRYWKSLTKGAETPPYFLQLSMEVNLWPEDGIQPERIESGINKSLDVVHDRRWHAKSRNHLHLASRVRIQSIERSPENDSIGLAVFEVLYASPPLECTHEEWYKSLTPASDVANEILEAHHTGIFKEIGFPYLILSVIGGGKREVDLYAYVFCADLAVFFLVAIFYQSVIKNNSEFLEVYQLEDQFPKEFVFILMMIFFLIVIDRIIYLCAFATGKVIFYLFNLLLFTYSIMRYAWYVDPSHKHAGRLALRAIYFTKAISLALQAVQIRFGVPRESTLYMQFLTSSVSQVNYLGFRLYRALPFLHELRCVLDWSCTTTSLTMYDWLKLEDIHASLFLVKCDVDLNRARHQQGHKQTKMTKFCNGICLFFVLMCVIWAPMLMYSSGNPTNIANPIKDASVRIDIKTVSGRLTLFQTTLCKKISWEEAGDSNLNLDPQGYLTAYSGKDIQLICCQADASTMWLVPPIVQARYMKSLTGSMGITFSWQFTRDRPKGKEVVKYELVVQDQDLPKASQVIKVLNGSTNSFTIYNVYPRYFRVTGSGDVRSLEHVVELVGGDLVLNRGNPEWWSFHDINASYVTGCGNIAGPMAIIVSEETPQGILGETLSKFSIWGLYITFVLAVGRFIRLQCSDLRMRIQFENLPSCDRLLAICEDIYAARAEGELKVEEVLYWTLVKIYRSPHMLLEYTKLD